MSDVTMPNDTVLYAVEDNVAKITLNRPDRYNTYNHDLTVGILAALDHARHDETVRAVLIHGNGPGYSAGADLKGFMSGTAAEIAEYIPIYYGSIVRKIINMEKPVISAIHGAVAGVALGMALASDLRIMADTANLRFPFINIALGPDGGAGWLIVRAVGYSRAFEIVTSGDKIPASRCYELGICNRIVPQDEMMESAMTWAKQLAAKAPLAMKITKQDLNHATSHTLAENVLFEAENQKLCLQSKDFGEGVEAFLTKRKPVFTGK